MCPASWRLGARAVNEPCPYRFTMSLYEITSDTPLQAPVLVAALGGWVDAGGVATAAAAFLAKDAEGYADFDADQLYDYRSTRPVLDVVDGRLSELTWPQLRVQRVRVGGRDLLVLSGPEPDMRWKALASAVGELALRSGVVESVSLGAIAAATPHTRPTPLLATASDPKLLREEDRPPGGLLRVPAAAVNLVELTLSGHGIPSLGFWAQVPHYVNVAFAPAVQALVERLGRYLGISFDLSSLQREGAEQREQLDAMVAQRPEARAYLEQLEQAYVVQDVPSGEVIAAEIERFLREQEGNPFEG
jgi:hypothetical protein